MELETIFKIVNLTILIVLLVLFLRKPLKRFFAKRAKNLSDKRRSLLKNMAHEEENYKKNYIKLKDIEDHIEKTIEDAEKDGESEGETILIAAEKMADRIISQSMVHADIIVSKKNREFYKDTIEKSVDEAENTIKGQMTEKKNLEFTKSFLKRLGGGEV